MKDRDLIVINQKYEPDLTLTLSQDSRYFTLVGTPVLKITNIDAIEQVVSSYNSS